MVKKRLADGSECRKCQDATKLIESRRYQNHINKVEWAVENDSESSGAKLAEKYGVERAPFFIVINDGKEVLYTSTLKFLNALPAGNTNMVNATLNAKVEHSKNIIKHAIEKYPNISVATSFGKDSMVVLHLALRIKPDIPCFAVLTPFKPEETFEYKDRMTDEWNLNLKVYMSKEKVNTELNKKDPNKCCEILKVIPTKEAIKDLDAWITGLRRTEGRTRTNYLEIEDSGIALTRRRYSGHGVVTDKGIQTSIAKINPILDWTETDIWRYTAIWGIPVNEAYKKGYRSLGCLPCTALPESGNEGERTGRWKGTRKEGGECGIHTMEDYSEHN